MSVTLEFPLILGARCIDCGAAIERGRGHAVAVEEARDVAHVDGEVPLLVKLRCPGPCKEKP